MKMNTLFIILIIILAFLMIGKVAYSKNFQKKETERDSRYDLLLYTIDPTPQKTKLQAQEEYKLYPPLHFERFRRKVKMLWGIDINDYPDNAIIHVGGYGTSYTLTLSKNYQLMNGFIPTDYDGPYTSIEHEKDIFPHLRAFTFMNDLTAKKQLSEYISETKNKYFEGHDIQWIDENTGEGDEGVEGADFFVMLYHNAIFNNNIDLVEYNIQLNSPIGLLNLEMGVSYVYEMGFRYSDLRLDLLSYCLKKELGKQKVLSPNQYPEKNQIWLGFNPYDSISAAPTGFNTLCFYPEKGNHHKYRPWDNYNAEKGICSFLSFVLQMQCKYMDKFVLRFMSGQIDKYIGGSSGDYHEQLRNNIRSNNYYGYTLLREFCENPMRETPILEKIGTSFSAKINKPQTLLYLEPFPESLDIDTINSGENFIVYEMGHDNYYLIEIEKPVESPIAGPDSYAMILDKKEIVHGYINKTLVSFYTDADILSEVHYNKPEKSKTGIIIDPDGYVNIRKERSTKAGIIGKITDKQTFRYWEIEDGNWYIIQTQDGLRGFVYKDRIKEKKDYNGWVLEN